MFPTAQRWKNLGSKTCCPVTIVHLNLRIQSALMMKYIVFLIFVLGFSTAEGTLSKWGLRHQVRVRGGAKIGQLDGKLALQLAKAATIAYVAGSGAKFVAKQTGSSNTKVSDSAVTHQCFPGAKSNTAFVFSLQN